MSSRTIEDKIYGKFRIDEPVLIDLIDSQPLQRLKRISQLGLLDSYYYKKGFSRYDHSIGVMLILRHFDASLEEQVAGLLHDVSHAAFSHLYDWVFGDATKPGNQEELQDARHLEFVKKSKLRKVLEKYGYDVDRISAHHHFSLLERELPDLCADRVDYSLREMPVSLAKKIFNGLTTFNGKIVGDSRETAENFAKSFLDLQMNHWQGYESTSRHNYMAGILRYALRRGIVTEADFFIDDEHIVDRLKGSNDPKILTGLQFIEARKIEQVQAGSTVYKKFRYIDPEFMEEGKVKRLSKVDPNFQKILEEARQKNLSGVLVPNFL